jgi:hypothetical protein
VPMQRTRLDGSGESNARLTKNDSRKQNRVNLGTTHRNPATKQ